MDILKMHNNMAKNRFFVIANWKMNGLRADFANFTPFFQFLRDIVSKDLELLNKLRIVFCLPYSLIFYAAQQLNSFFDSASPIYLGAQNCHILEKGAYTGEVSAAMLQDVGASYVILGHSERRTYNKELNEQIAQKAESALSKGLNVVICVGESLDLRERSLADSNFSLIEDFIKNQIFASLPKNISDELLMQQKILLAYEPVWAIGSGQIPGRDYIAQINKSIKQALTQCYGQKAVEFIPVLYGGSVKKENIDEICSIENVEGVLLGGSSLKCEDFLPIIDFLLKK